MISEKGIAKKWMQKAGKTILVKDIKKVNIYHSEYSYKSGLFHVELFEIIKKDGNKIFLEIHTTDKNGNFSFNSGKFEINKIWEE